MRYIFLSLILTACHHGEKKQKKIANLQVEEILRHEEDSHYTQKEHPPNPSPKYSF
ncbi:hypothetical protein N9Y92_01925 [Chlamydiales bacterium]|nr:hypothetical protein [Chlamydiales bacterium]